MKVSQVLNCSFSSWYPNFKDISIPSVYIPLPKEFIEYLNSEGVALPDSAIYDSGGADFTGDDGQVPAFPEFEAQIQENIDKLGGKVFPKLNWSSPQDATWISFDKTLKCTCPCDLYLLLKSSDFIAHDLTEPFIHCEDCGNQEPIQYELVLRKWMDIQTGMEFRCFVRDKNLIAISQRHHTQFYEFIGKDSKDIVTDIQSFYKENIQGKFKDDSFVFDVYRQDKGKVILLDFNPFGHVTDSQLFKWKELTSETVPDSSDGPTEPDQPAFRYVKSKDSLQPNPYAGYGMPVDFRDLASGHDPAKLMEFLSLNPDSFQDYNYHPDDEDDDGVILASLPKHFALGYNQDGSLLYNHQALSYDQEGSVLYYSWLTKHKMFTVVLFLVDESIKYHLALDGTQDGWTVVQLSSSGL
ncbi:hypothetical protein LOTGIDRAFT_228703 [Lottia gigantea]|uniref:Uncharacterized protein n=1 Tax=Lottia gigantea TaxID=225164 RepID=V4ACU8_LOTGI|nr:hypothetical protein LOTGIDRAFT_228703 [Lottia gigantea]ESO91151.1 hypothetical protein LOTGIDRAFT_228703 [Lottia gigantea]